MGEPTVSDSILTVVEDYTHEELVKAFYKIS